MWSWMLCLCIQRLEMALAYALTVWSAMARIAESDCEQGKIGRSP